MKTSRSFHKILRIAALAGLTVWAATNLVTTILISTFLILTIFLLFRLKVEKEITATL